MSPENKIELSNGYLYFKDVDKPIPVYDGEVTYETEYADDHEPYIKLSTEPVEFTLGNAEFNRAWTLVKCCKCGSNMPVTEFWALLYGRDNWICPMCKYKEAVIEALGR